MSSPARVGCAEPSVLSFRGFSHLSFPFSVFPSPIPYLRFPSVCPFAPLTAAFSGPLGRLVDGRPIVAGPHSLGGRIAREPIRIRRAAVVGGSRIGRLLRGLRPRGGGRGELRSGCRLALDHAFGDVDWADWVARIGECQRVSPRYAQQQETE